MTTRSNQYGLAGVGRVGEWVVELDELLSEHDTHPRFSLAISFRGFAVQLPPMPRAQFRAIERQLEARRRGEFSELFGAPISVEFSDDRACFRLVEGDRLLELSINDSELSDFLSALREACSDAEFPV